MEIKARTEIDDISNDIYNVILGIKCSRCNGDTKVEFDDVDFYNKCECKKCGYVFTVNIYTD